MKTKEVRKVSRKKIFVLFPFPLHRERIAGIFGKEEDKTCKAAARMWKWAWTRFETRQCYCLGCLQPFYADGPSGSALPAAVVLFFSPRTATAPIERTRGWLKPHDLSHALEGIMLPPHDRTIQRAAADGDHERRRSPFPSGRRSAVRPSFLSFPPNPLSTCHI